MIRYGAVKRKQAALIHAYFYKKKESFLGQYEHLRHVVKRSELTVADVAIYMREK